MIAVLLVLAAILGGAVGSFLNVVIWRVPRGESVVSPPSHCPHCDAGIRKRDNVPVLSWLVLRGKCRDCGGPISPRYPLVELATSIAVTLVALGFSAPLLDATTTAAAFSAILALVAFAYLAVISIALTLIDIDVFRLPNVIVLPAYLVGAVLLTASSLLAGDPAQLLRAAIGAAALFAFYFAAVLVYPGGMGFGDVKLAGVLGLFLAWLGWGELAVGAFAAFLLGGVFGIVLLAVKRAGRKTRIPFGPWMLGGAWVGIVVGEPVANWYLSLFGLA